jgi:membrane-associated protease RseP (regulator of RpoE activity)
MMMGGMGGMQMQDATYLGIEVSPIDPAMKAQLKLAKTDSGLLINFVADNSPAKAAGLQQYDVLAKLDDQLLFNPAQLQSLVRIHKAGDEVKLTYIREGQTQTTTAKLETKQQMVQPMGGPPGGMMGPMGGMTPEMMEHIQRQAHASADMARSPEFQQRMRQAMESSMAASRTITYEADDMSLILRPENGKPVLIARDKSGKELFNGSIETLEKREAIPDEVRKNLNKVAVNYLAAALIRPTWPMGFGSGFGPAHGMGGPGNPGGPGPDRQPDGEQ